MATSREVQLARRPVGMPKPSDFVVVARADPRGGDLVELVAVLAHNASLAVANARLVKRLRAAEDRLKKENSFLKSREQERRTGSRDKQQQIVGNSAPMRALLSRQVAGKIVLST